MQGLGVEAADVQHLGKALGAALRSGEDYSASDALGVEYGGQGVELVPRLDLYIALLYLGEGYLVAAD